MKIDDSQAASGADAPASGDAKAKDKTFSKVLAKLQESGAGAGAFGPGPDLLGLNAPAVQKSATPGGPDPSALIQSLVREIQTVVQPGGARSVEIRLNSQTLEGLNLRIRQEGDRIAVQFSTASQAVSKLLTQNVSQLSQALQAKGFQVAPIEVHLNPAAPASPSSQSSDRGRRDEGGGGREKRQR